MGWCGQYDRTAWAHGTLTPCITETTLAPLLVLLAATVLVTQLRRLAVLARRPYLDTKHIGAADILACVCYAALALSHAGWLVYWLVVRGAPFEVFFEACLLAVWLAAEAVAAVGCMRHVTLQLKLLTWPALVVYAWAVYTHALMLAERWGERPHVARALVVSSALQLAVLVCAAVAECLRAPSAGEAAVLKQALLSGGSGAVPAQSLSTDSRRKRTRPWWALLVTAVAYVWPTTPLQQLRAALCVVLLGAMRLINLAVPILYRDVVNTFSETSERARTDGDRPAEHFTLYQVFFPYVALYLGAAFLQGGAGTGSIGLLNNLRNWLWIPISQSAYRTIALDLFLHVLDLDLKFHLMRKTGEVTRIMDRGTASIQNILSTVLFSIVPQLFDIVAACIFIAAALEGWIAVIVFITLGSYILLTVYLTEWRTKYRRDLNKYDNAKGARVTDALLNYETVKYFNNETLERDNFAKAIDDYQRVEYKLTTSLNYLNILQSVIIFSGLVAGLTVCSKGVAEGRLTVGDAVLFITLMQQLYAPLNYFGSYYRTIQQQLIDVENTFDLLAAHASIQDRPGAAELMPEECSLEFDSVVYSYAAGSPVLKGVSFACPGGQTLALVGATGSGKSTALRLIFRFYDPLSGAVRIDGQDVRDVTQASLRSAMAVVPQDTVLFNDTIMYNIRYGRPSASDEEVYDAARAASLHDSIISRFPQQYDTVVGERGLRLSGGEKQRVACARAILKNPRVLLLDEATSALDTLTEQRIQGALKAMRADRTTIIVAHRLSTITDADVIIVLKEGEVWERGTHAELVAQRGLYAEMWARQAEAARAGNASAASLADVGADAGMSANASAASLAEDAL
ncbi:hypothetical protein WJX81_007044 [Elliptochloris bilobata]|uniref:Uncharacterized protein n=1 Tax=Elliptochloris bilobata TaxID=381761 RepID=A0AAW1QNC2_9CHLO